MREKKPLTDFILSMIVIALLLGSLRCIIGCAIRAAPAPKPRPVSRLVRQITAKDLAGHAWLMDWASLRDYKTVLAPSGDYAWGVSFDGWWSLENGQLYVSEMVASEREPLKPVNLNDYAHWIVTFERDRNGMLDRYNLKGEAVYLESGRRVYFRLHRSPPKEK